MIAAIYARKSTDDSDRTDEARSTTRQVDRATEYARAKGWTVDPRYIFTDEAVSGAEWTRRPGFNALLAALDPRPPFGVLIVSEVSRIGRASARTLYAVTQIEEAGVEIHGYLKSRVVTLEDEAGEVEGWSTPWCRAWSGAVRGSGPMTLFGAARRRGPSRGGACSATRMSATGTATFIG
jgi:hypothetical protein